MAWRTSIDMANFGDKGAGGFDFLSFHTSTVLLLRTLWLTPGILHFSHFIPRQHRFWALDTRTKH